MALSAVLDARINEIEPGARLSEALAVRGGRLLRIGTNREAGELIGGGTRAIGTDGALQRDADVILNDRFADQVRAVFADVGQLRTDTPKGRLQRSQAAMAFVSKRFVRFEVASVHQEAIDGPSHAPTKWCSLRIRMWPTSSTSATCTLSAGLPRARSSVRPEARWSSRRMQVRAP